MSKIVGVVCAVDSTPIFSILVRYSFPWTPFNRYEVLSIQAVNAKKARIRARKYMALRVGERNAERADIVATGVEGQFDAFIRSLRPEQLLNG